MNKAYIVILDNTLITTRSGKSFPLHSEDWKYKYEWYSKLGDAVKEGYKIVIIDNQFDAGTTGYVSDNLFNNKIEKICTIIEKELSLPTNSIITNFAFDDTDAYRCIPNPGLLYEIATEYDILLYNSILVGSTDEHIELAKLSGINNYYDVKDIF